MPASALIDSPVGPLLLSATGRGLSGLDFRCEGMPLDARESSSDDASAAEAWLAVATDQLDAYFAGERHEFDLPLDLRGTPFRLAVWKQIVAIPFGATASYADVAAAAGAPGAYRAAGSACGANRIAIIVPCHRVLGSDGSLHGFGGGLHTKRWLLAHEERVARSGGLLATVERGPRV